MLVVDDAEDLREMYSDLFTAAGFDVDQAGDCHEVFLAVSHQRPDVILMDIRLRTLDGLTIARVLKDDSDTSSIPIIAITGCSPPDFYRDRALAAGCDRFLTKPCRNEVLVDEVRHLAG